MKTQTTYDENGNPTQVVEGYGSLSQKVTTYAWNIYPRLLAWISTPTYRIQYGYGSNNRLTSTAVTSQVAGPSYGVTRTTTYNYVDHNGDGLPDEVVIDGPLPGTADAQTLRYANGNLTSRTMSAGTETFGGYNGLGLPGHKVDVNGNILVYDYDTRGRLHSITSNGVTSKAIYNAMGQISASLSPSGLTEYFHYDAAYRLTGRSYVEAFSSQLHGQAPGQRSIIYTVDTHGNRIAEATEARSVFFDYNERRQLRAILFR